MNNATKEVVLKELGETPKLCRNCNSQKTNNFSANWRISRARKMSERIALDTRSWKTLEQGIENTASFLIEQKKGPLKERINYTELYLDGDGDLFHPAFGKIKNGIEVKTEIDASELKAIDCLTEWANNYNSGQVIWISPPYPGQAESRFIVYDLQDIAGKKKIALHALCGNQSVTDCIFIAKQVAAFSDETIGIIDCERSLRETPVSFNPSPFYPSWIDLLKEVIHPPEIWDEIRAGNHIRIKYDLLKVSAEKIQIIYPDIANAQTDYEHLEVGARLENSFVETGYSVQGRGPCGMSNTLALQMLNTVGIGVNSAFGIMYEGLPSLENSFPCPECQKPIPSGKGVTKCPHCGITKEEYGSKCD